MTKKSRVSNYPDMGTPRNLCSRSPSEGDIPKEPEGHRESLRTPVRLQQPPHGQLSLCSEERPEVQRTQTGEPTSSFQCPALLETGRGGRTACPAPPAVSIGT